MRVQAGAITCRFLAAAVAAGLAILVQTAPVRAGDDRTISFYHIHTKETLTILYKKDGRFVPEAMEKISWILRDWRVNKATTMDPNTVDIIWEMHRELGSQQPVNIISGYRSPATNEMLRRTRGGQAKQSQHMTGKAIDISFPDVPLRRMRYSAMIRERGGVGYYPTSGIPFVHVDTSRVRHWPRMPRDELAILFPSGRSKHGSVSPSEVRAARERRKDLVQEVAQFMALHNGEKPAVQVAAATMPTQKTVVAQLPPPPQPTPAVRPLAEHRRMAVGAPPDRSPGLASQSTAVSVAALPREPKPQLSQVALTRDAVEAKPRDVAEPKPRDAVVAKTPAAPPKLVGAPKPIDRPSKFVAKLPDGDKNRLDMLVKLASLDSAPPVAAAVEPAKKPALITGSTPMRAAMTPDLSILSKKPVTAEKPAKAAAPPAPKAQVTAALAPATEPPAAVPPAAASSASAAAAFASAVEHPFGEGSVDWRSGWLTAPEYDEDHPEELSYRPFALAPLLTETSSFDDPALLTLVHPDSDMALAMLDDEGVALPMSFGAGHRQTAMAWAQEFRGDPVYLEALEAPQRADANATARQLVSRSVKILPR